MPIDILPSPVEIKMNALVKAYEENKAQEHWEIFLADVVNEIMYTDRKRNPIMEEAIERMLKEAPYLNK